MIYLLIFYWRNSFPLSEKAFAYIFFRGFTTLLFVFGSLNMTTFLSAYGLK